MLLPYLFPKLFHHPKQKGNDKKGGGAGSLGSSGSTRGISRVGDHGVEDRDHWPEVLEELAGQYLNTSITLVGRG